MKFLFVVQGEGRGHMTQALSLKRILEKNGHEICAVAVGKSQARTIPQFFRDRIGVPLFSFDSPNFKTGPDRRDISLAGTVLENLLRMPLFARSMKQLHRAIRLHKPDMVVNFFEILIALYGAFSHSAPRMVCIGHQYLMLHPKFVFPSLNPLTKWGMLLYVRLCAMGSGLRLALSFRKMPDVESHKLVVVPPLLRGELKALNPVTEDFILVYVLNDGYADDLAQKQCRCPEVKICGFWDRRGAPKVTQVGENLVFHQLDDVGFLDAMSRCRGLMCTAGFESVCEAMYLGKPVYMMPAGRQIEQQCNALDASSSGAGIWGCDFDLERFMEYLPRHSGNGTQFRNWVDRGESLYPALFEAAVHRRQNTPRLQNDDPSPLHRTF
jgi:uncharacterized protein (TIGR00661 family)